MNVNDVKTAAEDMVESKLASPLEGVYVKGVYGAELICGFDVVEANEFAGVFVLDSSGKPVVSSRIVEQKDAEIERLHELLNKAYQYGISSEAYQKESDIKEIYEYLYGGNRR